MNKKTFLKFSAVISALLAVHILGAQNFTQAQALLHAGADDAAIRTEVRVLQQLDKDDFLVEVDGTQLILDLDKATLRQLTVGGIYEVIGELERVHGEKYGVTVSYGIDALIIERRVAGRSIPAASNTQAGATLQGPLTAGVVERSVEITPIDNLRRGSFAAIQVSVHRVIDKDEIIVEDATGRIRVDLGNSIVSALRPGQTLIIEGFVDNGLKSFIRREFYASNIRLENGQVIEVRRNW